MFVKNEAHMFNMIMSSTFLILPYVLVSYPTNMCYHTCLRSCLFFFFFCRNPPGFAFLVFKYADDAEKAVRDLDGR